MELTTKGIPLSLRAAFQEYNLETLDPDEHAFTIIERTLAHGKQTELRWLFHHYGADGVAGWTEEVGWRLLPRRRFLFWSTYFNLPASPEKEGVWPH